MSASTRDTEKKKEALAAHLCETHAWMVRAGPLNAEARRSYWDEADRFDRMFGEGAADVALYECSNRSVWSRVKSMFS